MVSDEEIVSRLQEFLRTSDLNTTTTRIVRCRLEEDLGIDLSNKKAFIREQVDLFLQSQVENGEENDADEEQQEEEEEEEGAGGEGDEEEEEEEDQNSNVKQEEEEEEEDKASNSKDEEDEEDEEEEETRKGKRTRKRGSKGVKKRGGGGGFTKLCSLSPQLQQFTGVPVMARTEVVKQLWIYIKEKNLQDPSNRRNIVCDETLCALFGVKSINMFQMNKVLAKHIWPLDSDHGKHEGYDDDKEYPKVKEENCEKEPEEEEEEEVEEKVKEEEEEVVEEKVKEEEEEEEEVKAEAESNASSSKDEEDDEDEEVIRKEKSTRKKGSNKQNKEVKKRGGGGFTKLCSLSPQLQEFTGVPEMARTEVVKRLWAYIKEKDLQDPSNRRNIICDETLRPLFSVKSINMFQMNKALTKHIWPLESDDGTASSILSVAPDKSTQKEKQRKQERTEDEDEPKRKEKRQKGGTSGFLAPLQLSDALVKFLGTGESTLSRSEVVKRIWDYIKQNNLQDPSDKRIIISDEKLKELFDVDTFNGFTVSKLLTTHLTKTEQLNFGFCSVLVSGSRVILSER